MEKKDKMKWIALGVLVLVAVSVVLTVIVVAKLTHPTGEEAKAQSADGASANLGSVNGVLENAYIVSNQEDEIVVLYKDTYYRAEGTAQTGYTGVADIWLETGKIVKIAAKSNAIEGVLAAYSDSEVQIEGYEPLACASSIPVYRVDETKEGTGTVQQIADTEMVVGSSQAQLIVADGQACAIVTSGENKVDNTAESDEKNEDADDTIRVLLKNGSENTYASLFVSCDTKSSVAGKKKKAGKVISAAKYLKRKSEGTEIRITPEEGGLLYVCTKKGERLTEGYEGDFILRKTAEGYALLNELPIETYLRYVLPSEMPPAFSYEALKAQAVCARTFAYSQKKDDTYAAYGADLDDSTASQVYHASTTYETTDRAVEETAGEVLICDGALVDCYYYSTSPGYSEDLEVWNASSPSYLVAENHTREKTRDLSKAKAFHKFITKTVDSYDTDSPYYRWTATLSSALGMDEEYGRLKKLIVDKRSSSGYILSLTVVFEQGERTYTRENDIRFALGKYLARVELSDGTAHTDLASVPSACFEVSSQADGKIVLKGGGFGHGIGMSQYGADAMGREGKGYQDILAYYYQGSQVRQN